MEHAIVFFVAVAFYFVPSVVARLRWHRDEGAIFVVNLLLGWTVIGWIVALAWSATGNVHPRPANVRQ